MTEVEAVTLTQSILANAGNSYATFLTVLSGYLLVAHLAGKSLTSSQLAIITALYALSIGYSIYVWFGFARAGLYYQGIAAELRGTLDFSDERSAIFLLLLNIVIALAPIKYMWDVRH
jgi:F0F1-type ATP synthase membrane subunit a